MLDIINSTLNAIFNIFFLPFEDGRPFWALLLVSFVTGILMLVIFKATSDQSGIKRAKDLVKGHFLAIRLYRDDIGLMFDTMKNIVLSNLFYMRKSLRPMLFLIVPVALVLIQLGSRYEFRPFRVGESIVVSLQLAETNEPTDFSQVELSLPAGLRTDMPPVRVESRGEINWRLRAEAPGEYSLTFRYGDQSVTKKLRVLDRLVPVAPSVARDQLVVTLLNPAEPSLPETSFAKLISVTYPRRDFEFFGWQIHWLVAFFVLSLVAAFAFKGFLGVEV